MSQTETLRVGYVLKRYPRYSETFVVNEILAHEAAGVEIEIFALRNVTDGYFQDVISQVRAPVRYIPEKIRQTTQFWALVGEAGSRLPGFWQALSEAGDADGDDVAQAIRVALMVQEAGIAHLHAHFATVATTVARLAARFAGIGYSFTAHAKDIYFDYEENVDLATKMADSTAAITVSDYNLRHLRTTYPHASGRACRIYNGLDLSRLDYEEPVADGRTILAVGRLVEKKGFDVLVEALRILKGQNESGFDCMIVGDGPERERLEAQIERSGLTGSVVMTGPLPQRKIFERMRDAAMLAVPCIVGSDGNRDGLPTVLLEAMALGTPCLSTNVTGIPELVIDGKTGLCVEQGDPDELARAIKRLLDDHSLRLALSAGGRKLIEEAFDIHRNTAVQRDLFRSAAMNAAISRQEAAA